MLAGNSQSIAMARTFDPATRASVIMYKYVLGFLHGTLRLDEAALTDTAEALAVGSTSPDVVALEARKAAERRGAAADADDAADRGGRVVILAEHRSAAVPTD